MRLSTTFDVIVPNASKLPVLFPGQEVSPFQAVHLVALQPSSHLKACPVFPRSNDLGTFSFRQVSLLFVRQEAQLKNLIQFTPNPVVSFSRRAAECAFIQAISCLDYSITLFSLIGPLGSKSQLSFVRFYSVLQMILRTLRRLPLFYYAKRGYLALHHLEPKPLWTMGETTVMRYKVSCPTTIQQELYAHRHHNNTCCSLTGTTPHP